MKARLTFLVCFVLANCLSCSEENELDKAINEAIHDAERDDIGPDDHVSIRYYTEDKAR